MAKAQRPNVFNPVKPIPVAEREAILGFSGAVIWLTGLSGSGKSTLARGLERKLLDAGRITMTLDGDEVRNGLSRDLGFSQVDREENIRRISEVARLMADAGVICITSFISPLRRYREEAREIVGGRRFHEIYVDADLATCESRDSKGLYKKARAGEIKQFTGIDSTYEAPENPSLHVDTKVLSREECLSLLFDYLRKQGVI